jgi:hypothetical protein
MDGGEVKSAAVALLALAVAASAPAQRPQVPRASTGTLTNQLAKGETLETRADGDLNGDGDADVAFIGRGEDRRTLYVLMAYRSETDMGHDPAGQGALNAYPLGNADLKIARGVLVVEDMTGGTTATSGTYRLRWNATAKKMQLIGFDTTLYSRTWSHDGVETSWNLLTGVRTRRTLKLVSRDGPYTPGPLVTKKVPVKPVYIDRLPELDATQ